MQNLKAIQNRIHDLLTELKSLETEVVNFVESASKDPLTKLFRRESFLEQYQSLSNTHSSLCLLVLDVDHFKKVNDRLGHAGGDRVLQAVAEIIGRTPGAISGRFGGEEFLVAIPGELGFATARAETLRKEISTLSGDLACTISIGVAQMKPMENFTTLFERADQALYAAKNGGRNQVKQAA